MLFKLHTFVNKVKCKRFMMKQIWLLILLYDINMFKLMKKDDVLPCIKLDNRYYVFWFVVSTTSSFQVNFNTTATTPWCYARWICTHRLLSIKVKCIITPECICSILNLQSHNRALFRCMPEPLFIHTIHNIFKFDHAQLYYKNWYSVGSKAGQHIAYVRVT